MNICFFPFRLLQVVIAAALLPLPSVALAQEDDYINPDRPGIADGSKVVGANRFQIETGIQYETRQSGPLRDRRLFIPTLIRIGLNESWEARIESNAYTWKKVSDPANGVIQSQGSSPISLGIKYHFQESNDKAQPSLGAILRIFPVTGSGEFRTRHTTGDFRLAADWDFAQEWSLNPNIGVAVYEDDQNQLFTAGLLAVTLNYNPSKTLNFFADTGMQSPEGKNGKSAIIYDAGVAYLVSRDIQVDFSVGAGTTGTTPPRTFFSFGISKRF